MGWFQRIESNSNTQAVRPGLPRKVLHHLIVKGDLAVGARILDVGCGRGELVQFLDQLGFDAAGIDDSRENIAVARHRVPSLDFRCLRADEITAAGQHTLDLVLVRDFDAYRENLNSPAALKTTANLLSCVTPGGFLVFLVRSDSVSNSANCGHHIACYAKHLLEFPGHCETTGLSNGFDQPQTWRSLLAGGPRSGFVTVTIRLPREPVGRCNWLRLADQAAAAHRQPCCRRFAELHPETAESRSAA